MQGSCDDHQVPGDTGGVEGRESCGWKFEMSFGIFEGNLIEFVFWVARGLLNNCNNCVVVLCVYTIFF